MDDNKVPIEAAIDKAGFGLYSYLMTSLTGVIIISLACICYSNTILVPASACELKTTPAQQGLLAAAPIIGTILGTVVWGYLADTRGRRAMLFASLLSGALINMIASISVNWIMLMTLQFFASLCATGLYSMAMSLLSESVPLAKRNLVVLLVTSIFLLSQGIMAVLSIPIIPLKYSYYVPALNIYWNSWRTLVVVYSMPCLVSAIWLYFMRESPKFVNSKGNHDEALEILHTIFRINHLESKKELEVTSLLSEEPTVIKHEIEAERQGHIVPLFRPPLLKYTLIISTLFLFQQTSAFLIWLPTVANQFMKMISTGEGTELPLCGIINASMNSTPDPEAVPCALNTTAMIIVLAVGALQSFVNLLISLIVNDTGRRNVVIVLASVCGVSGIVVNLVPNAYGSAAMFAVLLCGFVVLGLYTAMVVAYFPTQYRAIAIAIPMTVGRVGSFASVQILNMLFIRNCEAGFYIFCSIFASSAIVASFLPDDRRLSSKNPTLTSSDDKPVRLNENITRF